MSKIVKDGSKEDLFEYYPKLFQKLLEWSPDGSINKRNLIDIRDMLKADFELLSVEMKLDTDRIIVILVKESDIEKNFIIFQERLIGKRILRGE